MVYLNCGIFIKQFHYKHKHVHKLVPKMSHKIRVQVNINLPQQVGFLWIEYQVDQQRRQSRTWEMPASWSPGTQQGPSHTQQVYMYMHIVQEKISDNSNNKKTIF